MEQFAEFTEIACSLASWIDRVDDHDPKWHEFGALRHTLRVFQNAMRIRARTGIDIVKVALWHDIGKFVPGVRKAKEDKLGEFSFKGHEIGSVEWLKRNGPDFDEDDLLLITSHGIIRGDSSVKDIVSLCKGDSKLLKKLVLLCAADISGKGFTLAQKEQRERLAPKFEELADEAGLERSLVGQIVRSW